MTHNKCPNCKHIIENGVKECLYCGTNILEETQRDSSREIKYCKGIDLFKKELPGTTPTLWESGAIYNLIAGFFFIGIFLVFTYVTFSQDENNLSCFIWLIISALVSIGCFGAAKNKHKCAVRYYISTWEEYKKNPDSYRKRSIYRPIENNTKPNRENTAPHHVVVKCPYCDSTNTKKISTTSRATSILAVGILSKKIGKQWHCNNCKSDF